MPAARRSSHTSYVYRLFERVRQIATPGSRPGAEALAEPCGPDVRAIEIAHVAHDLRNQLTMVIACADEVSRTAGFHNEQTIGQLLRCAERAAELTGDLLDVAGPRPSTPAQVDLNEVVAHAAAGFSCFDRRASGCTYVSGRIRFPLWPGGSSWIACS